MKKIISKLPLLLSYPYFLAVEYAIRYLEILIEKRDFYIFAPPLYLISLDLLPYPVCFVLNLKKIKIANYKLQTHK